MEVTEYKLNDAISKRNLAVQCLVVVAGGIVWLTFMPFSPKTLFFIIVGLYYAYVLSSNYVDIDGQIKSLIKESEAEK